MLSELRETAPRRKIAAKDARLLRYAHDEERQSGGYVAHAR